MWCSRSENLQKYKYSGPDFQQKYGSTVELLFEEIDKKIDEYPSNVSNLKLQCAFRSNQPAGITSLLEVMNNKDYVDTWM